MNGLHFLAPFLQCPGGLTSVDEETLHNVGQLLAAWHCTGDSSASEELVAKDLHSENERLRHAK